MTKVMIWDDKASILKDLQDVTKRALPKGMELIEIQEEGILKLVRALESRLADPGEGVLDVLDSVDVLFIDFDLRCLDGHAWLTAEGVAGLVRAFTNCAMVVVMNRPPTSDFDLTMTRVWQSKGDVCISNRLLGQTSFWLTPPLKDGPQFRPWELPDFSLARKLHTTRVDELSNEKLDLVGTSVLEFLGVPQDVKSLLSSQALAGMSPEATSSSFDISLATFLKKGVTSLPADTLEMVSADSNGKYRAVSARILAGELARWCKYRLLAAQDSLVDIPHLAQRSPWFVIDYHKGLAAFNSLPIMASTEGIAPILKKHQFLKFHWLDRPAYWWPLIQQDTDALKFLDDADQKGAPEDIRFLEDASCFARAENSEEFRSCFGNVWDQRYIRPSKERGGLIYAPAAQLAV